MILSRRMLSVLCIQIYVYYAIDSINSYKIHICFPIPCKSELVCPISARSPAEPIPGILLGGRCAPGSGTWAGSVPPSRGFHPRGHDPKHGFGGWSSEILHPLEHQVLHLLLARVFLRLGIADSRSLFLTAKEGN